MKQCTKCASRDVAPGHKSWCRPCLNTAQRQWNASETGPRYRRYGLRKSDVQAMRDAQGNACAICGDSFEFVAEHVDHDHISGKNRDLLCGSCNQGLGNFKDNPTRLAGAIMYLERHRKGGQ